MAMTKRIRVSFDLKLVLDSETEKLLIEEMLRVTRIYHDKGKVDGFDLAAIKAGLEGGPDAALELRMKSGIKERIVSEIASDNEGIKVSNFRFEVKQ